MIHPHQDCVQRALQALRRFACGQLPMEELATCLAEGARLHDTTWGPLSPQEAALDFVLLLDEHLERQLVATLESGASATVVEVEVIKSLLTSLRDSVITAWEPAGSRASDPPARGSS